MKGKIVLDNNGSAVAGVTVTLIQVSTKPQPAFINPPNSGTVTTTSVSATVSGAATTAATTSAGDGSFAVPGLASGQYAVCVKDPKAAVIDPCIWTDSETTVPVTEGSLTSGLVVRVKAASTVTVQVNDTAQALTVKPGELYPPHVLVGAFDIRGGFHPALEQKSTAGITYRLAIPVDSPIRMTIYSAAVRLATTASAPLPAQGYSTTFVQPSSQSQTSSFTFNAVGRN